MSGFGSSNGHHFPDELGRVLGSGFEVRNFGVSGTTILKKGDDPYWRHGEMGQSLAYRPDIAVFWFGGNDTKPQNWNAHKAEFIPDYEDLLHMFQALPTKPRLFLFQSIILEDRFGIQRKVVDNEILPLTAMIAADTMATVLNDHDAFINHPELFIDGIHPSDRGNAAIAVHVAGYITRALAAADAGVDATGGGPGDASSTEAAAGLEVADASSSEVTAPVDATAVTPNPTAPVDVAVEAAAPVDASASTVDVASPKGAPTTIFPVSNGSGCSIATGNAIDVALIVVVGLLTLMWPGRRRRRRR